MVLIFIITAFLSAALLFAVQPMAAKALLPIFGGGPSVWTTCMLFFQSVLIGGYLYAHLLLTKVPKRAQIPLHSAVLTIGLGMGVLLIDPAPPPGGASFPILWLLGQLVLVCGFPFFALSSAGPLVQAWFNKAGARDPYFLYAASNAGSLIGLLSYPVLIEPLMPLGIQWGAWLVLFAAFTVLSIACLLRSRAPGQDQLVPNQRRDRKGSTTRRARSGKRGVASGRGRTRADQPVLGEPEVIGWTRRLWWVYLAFVPSTMLLAVTTYISTDIASFPLLWVAPLAIYLVTMIIAFSGRSDSLVKGTHRPMVIAVIGSMIMLIARVQTDDSSLIAGSIAIQLIMLGVVALFGHARLAQDRPHPSRLTEYFLLISVGGALGGLVNAVAAPMLLNDTFEYHASLLAALLMLPAIARGDRSRFAYWARRLALPVACVGWVLAAGFFAGRLADPLFQLAALVGPPAVLVYLARNDRVACVGSLAPPIVAIAVSGLLSSAVLYQERTFFGVHRVERHVAGGQTMHWLLHGTTIHGSQIMGDPVLQREPLAYYHRNGPCGIIMGITHARHSDGATITVVGLGSGAVLAYGRESDRYTVLEIDPAVVKIASDPSLFTFLQDSRAPYEIQLGDGRVLLEQSRDAGLPRSDLIIVDAFSSDAIPSHLLTREALALYLDRLADNGMIAIHISNRHLDLFPLVHALGTDARVSICRFDDIPDPEEWTADGRDASEWVVLTKSPAVAQDLVSSGFDQFPPGRRIRLWTDQYSNLLDVLRIE